MPTRRHLLTGAALAVTGLAGCASGERTPSPTPGATPVPGEVGAPTFESPAFDDGGTIPARHTCSGENVSPPLTVTGVPDGAETFALVMTDPDANGYVHWLVWNVPADTIEWPEGVPNEETVGELGGATQGSNSRGEVGYFGPCPPPDDGAHTYRFVLHALPTTLDLDPGAERRELERAIDDADGGSARLEGEYDR